MRGSKFGQFVGLPKEIVVAMLGVAMLVTFAVELTAFPRAADAAPTIKFSRGRHVPRDHADGSRHDGPHPDHHGGPGDGPPDDHGTPAPAARPETRRRGRRTS